MCKKVTLLPISQYVIVFVLWQDTLLTGHATYRRTLETCGQSISCSSEAANDVHSGGESLQRHIRLWTTAQTNIVILQTWREDVSGGYYRVGITVHIELWGRRMSRVKMSELTPPWGRCSAKIRQTPHLSHRLLIVGIAPSI
jgi:hypothetical protein